MNIVSERLKDGKKNKVSARAEFGRRNNKKGLKCG